MDCGRETAFRLTNVTALLSSLCANVFMCKMRWSFSFCCSPVAWNAACLSLFFKTLNSFGPPIIKLIWCNRIYSVNLDENVCMVYGAHTNRPHVLFGFVEWAELGVWECCAHRSKASSKVWKKSQGKAEREWGASVQMGKRKWQKVHQKIKRKGKWAFCSMRENIYHRFGVEIRYQKQ